LFPGRWRWITNSSWNRAKDDRRITFIPMGAMAHNGPRGYLDAECFLDNGQSHLDATLGKILGIVRQHATMGVE
jgi:hypothetical protein